MERSTLAQQAGAHGVFRLAVQGGFPWRGSCGLRGFLPCWMGCVQPRRCAVKEHICGAIDCWESVIVSMCRKSGGHRFSPEEEERIRVSWGCRGSPISLALRGALEAQFISSRR